MNREDRIAAIKARRGTDEWKSAGAELTAQREVDRKAQVAVARERQLATDVAYWEDRVLGLSPNTLSRHMERSEKFMQEAAEDSGVELDTVGLELLDSYILAELPLTRGNVAVALELLRCRYGLSVREGLTHLRRLGK